MTDPFPAAVRVAQLESRVAVLEEKLAERSRTLRRLSRELCLADLEALIQSADSEADSQIALRAGGIDWSETTELQPGDVEGTMAEVWRSAAASHWLDEE